MHFAASLGVAGSKAFELPRVQKSFELELPHQLPDGVLYVGVEVQPSLHIHAAGLIREQGSEIGISVIGIQEHWLQKQATVNSCINIYIEVLVILLKMY